MDKKYNYKKHEPEMQEFWSKQKIYVIDDNDAPSYTIDTPPPTISGTLHIGHIFSYTQTDIIARYKRLNGHNVFYPFGFDNNGLPTERYIEKKEKIRAHDMTRSAFTALCKKEAESAEKEFKALWQRVGISADWQKTYSTISDDVRALSQESFIRLYKKGFIYRKYEPALYCTTCHTSVAQAELEDKQLPSFFNDIIFKDENGNDIIIGTTRPELLPSCVAVLFHPQDERYQHLQNSHASVPLFDLTVPLLADEHVDRDKGTGLVMVCTFGDKMDIEWYKKHKLAYRQSIGFDGRFTKIGGFLAGLKTIQARANIIEELIKQNLLTGQKEIVHTVNVHERCKKEAEFLSLPQWFVTLIDHKEKLLALSDTINWSPTFMKSRFDHWVKNLEWDWGISRQRFFGIPFPVWHCNNCSNILIAEIKDLPIDPQETQYSGPCPKCSSTDIVPDKDVMDTWNTSSLTPYICYQLRSGDKDVFANNTIKKEFLPMNMRPQAHDIIRTWAFYTIAKTWMHHDTMPWQDIVISGHVLSGQKEKLSKSGKQSQATPEKLLEQYPADAIRYWTASARLGNDTNFAENELKIGKRLVTKLWNAFLFAQPHTQEIDIKNPPQHFGAVNEWILHASTTCFSAYKKHFEQYEFGLALEPLEQFFWNDFCDNYIELIKNQLFNPQEYDDDHVYATRWTLHAIGLRILQLYAPYIPHVTETIYQNLYAKNNDCPSIHTTQFKDIQIPYVFKKSNNEIGVIVKLVATIRKLKTENKLSLKAPLASLTIYYEDETYPTALKQHEQLLSGIIHTKKIVYKKNRNPIIEMQTENDIHYAYVVLN